MDPGFRVFQTKPAPVIEITDLLMQSGPPWYHSSGEVVLSRTGNELTATFFQSGIAVVAEVNPYRNEYYMNFRIQVPLSYSRRTQGMLGNLDDDPTNDFYRRGETEHLPNSISERELFREFQSCM